MSELVMYCPHSFRIGSFARGCRLGLSTNCCDRCICVDKKILKEGCHNETEKL